MREKVASLVLAADYNSVIEQNDGSYTTKRTRRHFHAKDACISSVPAEMKRYTNMKPVSSCIVDTSTLPKDTKEQIKQALPNINFS
jgi:RNase adaptor protein for sRNA GlmZ degradation